MNPNLLRVCQRSFGEGYATSATYAPTVSCCWRDHRQRCDARDIPRAGSCRSNRPRRFVHLASWIFRARACRTQDAHAHLQRESSGAADGHAAGTHLTRHAREHTAARSSCRRAGRNRRREQPQSFQHHQSSRARPASDPASVRAGWHFRSCFARRGNQPLAY